MVIAYSVDVLLIYCHLKFFFKMAAILDLDLTGVFHDGGSNGTISRSFKSKMAAGGHLEKNFK